MLSQGSCNLVVLVLSCFTAVHGQCVMKGVCGASSDHNCLYSGPPFPTVPQVQSYCNWDDETACCDANQMKMLATGFQSAEKWFGSASTCFKYMKSMFCKMHCDSKQNQTVEIAASSNEIVDRIEVFVDTKDAQLMFDECYKVKLWIGIRVANQVCLKYPCDAQEFLRGLGSRSPYKIEFKMV